MSDNHIFYIFSIFVSYFDKIQYTNVVFKNTNKAMNGNIKSLTIENLKENNENHLTESEARPRDTTLSTDSDYLSTRPSTEMTEVTTNYRGLDGLLGVMLYKMREFISR